MAYPNDPSSPAAGEHGAFANARLSPDDFERLANAFRPSWELDDAPFTGAASFSPADLRALQGGGTRAEVRAVAQATNGGGYPPPVVAAPHVPEGAGVVDRPAPPVDVAPPPPAPVARPSTPAFARPSAPPLDLSPRPRVANRAAPPMPVAPVARARLPSADLEEPFARSSKKPLWLGLGAGAVGLIVVGIWAVSGHGPDKSPAPAVVSVDMRAQDNAPPIPPPPQETATAVPASPPPLPARPAAAVPAAPAIPTTAVTALPIAAPPPARVVASPPPRPVYVPAPKPAPRPKAGTTIVRDVPF
jgi:hypothetical protein